MRAEPLLLAHGRLERHQDRVAEGDGEPVRPVINVLVRELAALERYLPGEAPRPPSGRRRQPRCADGGQGREEPEGAEVGSSMRAAAPPVQSFAAGRRR